jgi:hypothetical protein
VTLATFLVANVELADLAGCRLSASSLTHPGERLWLIKLKRGWPSQLNGGDALDKGIGKTVLIWQKR